LGSSPKDANGNMMTWGPGGLDSLGRALVAVQTPTNQRIYTVKDSSGNNQTYTVNLNSSYTIKTNLPDAPGAGSGVLKQINGSAYTVISSIVLPNGRSYVFKYDQPSPYAYANLVEIDLPTGAVTTYSWATFGNSDSSSSRKVTDRTVTVNGQQYHWHFDQSTGTVTDPAGNQSVYSRVQGTILSAKFYAGTASGNPVRQYQMSYVNDASDPMQDPYQGTPDPEYILYNPGRRLTSITTTLDDGRVSKKEYDSETFNYTYHPRHSPLHYTEVVTFTTSRGNVTESREYDYGAVPGTYGQNTPGALLRRTDKTYLTIPTVAI
jgi:hypothetical protein